jgi:hypothetical protein
MAHPTESRLSLLKSTKEWLWKIWKELKLAGINQASESRF